MRIILIAMLIAGCTSLESVDKDLDDMKNESINRASMTFYADNVNYDGVATLPRRLGVGTKLRFKLPEKTELFILETCAKHLVNVKPKGDYFDYKYRPFLFKEAEDSCLLRATAINYKGETQTAIIDWSDSRRLEADVFCNDSQSKLVGVAICQNQQKKLMWIDFKEPVVVAGQAGCNPIESYDNGRGYRYQIKIDLGFCVYGFMSQSGEKFRLTTYGYNSIQEVLIK